MDDGRGSTMGPFRVAAINTPLDFVGDSGSVKFAMPESAPVVLSTWTQRNKGVV